MEDQLDRESLNEPVPETAFIDLEELSQRVMIARIRKGMRSVPPLLEAIEQYVSDHHLDKGISRGVMYRIERGVYNPSADELVLLTRVLEPEGGMEYFMPFKRGVE
ncbi:MAG: helix-turn-helix transcriptional regulator [Coriobacteriia bacterium]|nr:helix-turn-helix transcriptional regulator [Coriobacteriia bacterium]